MIDATGQGATATANNDALSSADFDRFVLPRWDHSRHVLPLLYRWCQVSRRDTEIQGGKSEAMQSEVSCIVFSQYTPPDAPTEGMYMFII